MGSALVLFTDLGNMRMYPDVVQAFRLVLSESAPSVCKLAS